MIKAILASSRPISWVNTAIPFALAYLLDAGHVDWLFIMGFIFFLIPYNIAIYGINDVFDYESDIRNPRKGGVEGAVLPKDLHKPVLIAACVTTLPFAVVLYLSGTGPSALWLTIALFAVIAYSAPPFRFKEIPVLDSVTSSTHFVAPALVGATMVDPTVGPQLWRALVAFFLWGVASHALGAVQDVVADREGGIRSVATQLGARLTTRIASAIYMVAALLAFTLSFPGVVVGLIGLGYFANCLRFINVTDETSSTVNSAWRVFLWLNFLAGGVVTIAVLLSVFPVT